MRRRAFLALLAVAAVAAPQPARAQETKASVRQLGVYHFVERIQTGGANAPILLEGDFTILTDTLLVYATPGPCRYDMRSTGVGPMLYQCADITLKFDRKDPLRHPSYSVTVLVTQQQRICASQRTDGTCARVSFDQVERPVMRQGIIHGTKVDTSKP